MKKIHTANLRNWIILKTHQVQKCDYLNHLIEAEETQFLSAEEIQTIQLNKLKNLILVSLMLVVYYQMKLATKKLNIC